MDNATANIIAQGMTAFFMLPMPLMLLLTIFYRMIVKE